MKKLLYVCLVMSVTTSAFAQLKMAISEPIAVVSEPVVTTTTTTTTTATYSEPVASETQLSPTRTVLQEAALVQPIEEAVVSEYDVAPTYTISKDSYNLDSVSLSSTSLSTSTSLCRSCVEEVAIDTSGTLTAVSDTGGLVADTGSTTTSSGTSGGGIQLQGDWVLQNTGTVGTVVNTTITAVNPYEGSNKPRATFNLQYANIVGADGSVSSGSHSDAVKSDLQKGKFKSVGYQFSVTTVEESQVCLSGTCSQM